MIYLTDHALTRYRQRMGKPAATRVEVEAVLAAGSRQSRWGRCVAAPTDAWIVVPGGAFPIVRHLNGERALTFYVKRVVPKADRRAWLELRRDEQAAA